MLAAGGAPTPGGQPATSAELFSWCLAYVMINQAGSCCRSPTDSCPTPCVHLQECVGADFTRRQMAVTLCDTHRTTLKWIGEVPMLFGRCGTSEVHQSCHWSATTWRACCTSHWNEPDVSSNRAGAAYAGESGPGESVTYVACSMPVHHVEQDDRC